MVYLLVCFFIYYSGKESKHIIAHMWRSEYNFQTLVSSSIMVLGIKLIQGSVLLLFVLAKKKKLIQIM